MRRVLTQVAAASFCLAVAVLGACSDDNTTGNGSSSGTSGTGTSSGNPADALANAKPVAEQYAKNVYANYSEALTKAKALQTAIDAFLAAPSEGKLTDAKAAWIAAREPYGPTEVYRFYEGPIDNATDGPEGEINAWPLDENAIDYTRDDADAGIINRTADFATITKDIIRTQNANETDGETYITTGYHAIEFLLWGQDSTDTEDKQPGSRPFTDYTTKSNFERRKEYLKLVTEILIEDLQTVTDAWAPGQENYAKTFVADPKDAVTKMLMGIGSMANAELSGERMTTAYINKSQEDEHSCFSDNTKADLLGNFLGIQNVYLGKYGASTGPGLDSLVKAVDSALDTKMKADLTAAVTAINAIPAPFDYAVTRADDSAPERQAVLTAIKAIKTAADNVVVIGQKLGVTFDLEKPTDAIP